MAMIAMEHADGPPFDGEDKFGQAISVEIGKCGAAHQSDSFKSAGVFDIQFEFPVAIPINARTRSFRIPPGNHAAADKQTEGAIAINVAERQWTRARLRGRNDFFDRALREAACE